MYFLSLCESNWGTGIEPLQETRSGSSRECNNLSRSSIGCRGTYPHHGIQGGNMMETLGFSPLVSPRDG